MKIQEHVSLQRFNSFGFPAQARYFLAAASEDDILAGVRFAKAQGVPLLVLGGGSNVLLSQDFPGLVLHMATRGRTLVGGDESHYYVKVAAGENWHDFVAHCVEAGYYGIENLALIPGTAGAAPIQNIGAYGVELEQIFQELEALDLQSGERLLLDAAACRFSYRQSLFKQDPDRYIVLNVTFRLAKDPCYTLGHAALIKELEAQGGPLSARAIFEAVCAIRRRNLPDPLHLGNAGSFFMNPVVPADHYARIKARFPTAPGFPAGDGRIKLAAGWLIDQCGYKGRRVKNVGTFANNALVLVNYGGASCTDILAFAGEIQLAVRNTFGVDLSPEPRRY